jgi:aminoglycoside phosphotransferase (APT) family kinase protein
VNAVAEVSPEWPYGVIRVRSVVRIGAGHGLSGGEVYRVEADSEQGCLLSFVLKREDAQGVERALLFHRTLGSRIAGLVPACLGGCVDRESGAGVLLTEDVAPAVQGDVLSGCTDLQALAAVRSLARVHAASAKTIDPGAAGAYARWQGRAIASEDWVNRLAAAENRFPGILTAAMVDRLRELPRTVERAILSLERDEACWIHGDAHLDNVLFRPDGLAVLIDWSGAAIGPPAVDFARLLTEGIDAGSRHELAGDLLSAYTGELAASGLSVMITESWDRLSNGLALLIQASVGWAARDEVREPRARMRALQEKLLRSTCAWATVEQMTSEGRVFAN